MALLALSCVFQIAVNNRGVRQTVHEPPSALRVPSLETQPEPAGDAVGSASGTAHDSLSALEVPPLEAQGSVDPGAATMLQSTPVPASARAVLEVTGADGSRSRVELREGRHDI